MNHTSMLIFKSPEPIFWVTDISINCSGIIKAQSWAAKTMIKVWYKSHVTFTHPLMQSCLGLILSFNVFHHLKGTNVLVPCYNSIASRLWVHESHHSLSINFLLPLLPPYLSHDPYNHTLANAFCPLLSSCLDPWTEFWWKLISPKQNPTTGEVGFSISAPSFP